MGAIKELAEEVYRDFVNPGDASSGKWNPPKPDVLQLWTLTDGIASSAGTTKVYATRAGADGLLAHPGTAQGDRAEVRADPAGNVTNGNGVYGWDVGSNAWVWISPLLPATAAASASTVTGGGLAVVTGAGNLGGNNTITVAASTPVTVAEGTADDEAVTPAALEPVLFPALGAGMNLYDGPDVAGVRPIFVNDKGGILFGFETATGAIVGSIQGLAQAISYLSSLYEGVSDDPDIVPIYINDKGAILLGFRKSTGAIVGSLESSVSTNADALAYIDTGALRVIGGDGPDRVLNDDADKLWRGAQSYGRSVQAVYSVVGSPAERYLRRISLTDGTSWPDGEITIITGDGQSNPEGQAGAGAQVLRQTYPFADRLRMPGVPLNNVWVGMTTSGGDSIDFDEDSLTALVPLRGSLAPTGIHGTTSIESAGLRFAEDAFEATGGWTPNLLVWTNSEGGQTIANLSDGAPAGFYAFDNVVKILTKVQALAEAENRTCVYRYMLMGQGEADASNANLGPLHETYRSQIEAQAVTILGQTVPLRMLSQQMSSFYSASTAGVLSILAESIDTITSGGKFYCLGPSYNFPFWTDLLHQTSLGHDQVGELYAIAVKTLEQGEDWDVLRPVSGAVTGTNQITVTMSEPCEVDAVTVPAIANLGVTLAGATMVSTAVVGGNVVLTTSGGAASWTSISFGLSGHVGVRTEATQARTNLRSVEEYGAYRNGAPIVKWCAHSRITP